MLPILMILPSLSRSNWKKNPYLEIEVTETKQKQKKKKTKKKQKTPCHYRTRANLHWIGQ